MFSCFTFRLLAVLLSWIVVYAQSRLNCLQHNLGKEENHTDWKWGPVSSDPVESTGWVYNNSVCPLTQFNEKEFCTKAIECGKKLLLVGDSTIESMILNLPHLMKSSVKLSLCPTDNYCSPANRKNSRSISFCQTHGYSPDKIRDLTACQKYCGQNPVNIVFIRHNFVNNIHGPRNRQSLICEHWKDIAHKFDYVLVSVGPHIPGMIGHPFGRPADASFNETEFFIQEGREMAELLLNVTSATAAIIYKTGPVGIPNFQVNCTVPPWHSPPVLSSQLGWNKIPLLNAQYIEHIQQLPGNRAIVMDTLTLLSKMHGCRPDFLHFHSKFPASPVLLEWLILHNLLLEYHDLPKTQVP